MFPPKIQYYLSAMSFHKSTILRNLTLQKAILSILLLILISLLIGWCMGDFYTKGEPREALVAQRMLAEGKYVLVDVYGNEFAYKPPLFHWLVVAVSSVTGGVTSLTARFPSVLSLLVMGGAMFVFLANRLRYRQAYIATLLLLTSFEVHRAAFSARVDMLLTCFIVLTLLALYKWEDEERLAGLPWYIPVLISGGILTKGPVALALPLLIFFVYLLLLRQYRFTALIKPLFFVALTSMVVPALWYYAAYRLGGTEFLQVVFAENIGRFFHLPIQNLPYNLGHQKPFFYPLLYVVLGFLPWVLLLPWIPQRSHLQKRGDIGVKLIKGAAIKWLNERPKLHLFSWVVIVITLLFYMIPSSKRAVYLLPVYPFVSILIAYYLLGLQRLGRKSLRIFSWGVAITSLAFLGAIVALLVRTPEYWSRMMPFLSEATTMLAQVREGLLYYFPLTVLMCLMLLVITMTLLYQAYRHNYTKLIVTNIALLLVLQLVIDGPVLAHYKELNSARPFAQKIAPKLQAEKLYVINDQEKGFRNMYGLVFYLNKPTYCFNCDLPTEGFLVLFESNWELLQKQYGERYNFQVVDSDALPIQEGDSSKQMLLSFKAKY